MLRQRRQRTRGDSVPVGPQDHRRDDEAQRHQAEERNALLDEAEGALPEEEPYQEGDWQRPERECDAGDELKGETDAADFRREDEEVDQRDRDQRQEKECEAEAIADG